MSPVALVTGAGSPTGIGFATAKALARAGMTVAIASTTETINFAAKPGRYVRVTVTAPGIHWWSIDEFSVLCK